MAATKELLFTYGTLRKGESNPMQRYLENNAEWIAKATFQGKLYFADGHPAATPTTDENSQILGDLFEFDESSGLLQELDRYEAYRPANPEKSLYLRKKRKVSLNESNEIRDAWIYIYNRPVDNATPIPSGDYAQFSKG